jgi:AhpD family alkylhydroperoxidase
MHLDRGFRDLDEGSAPEAARAVVVATRAKFGFVPSALARMVASPLLTRAFQNAIAAFDKASLTEAERETAILAMARVVGCEVCITLHAKMLAAAGSAELADRVRIGATTDDVRLDALVRFVEAAVAMRGDVDGPTWRSFLEAGFTREQALETVLGIGAYTMSMYANRLTAANVDV